MNKTKTTSSPFMRKALHRPGLFRSLLMTVLLLAFGIAAVPVEMSSHQPTPPRPATSEAPVNLPARGSLATATSTNVWRGGPRALSFSPQSVPAAWDFETVAPVAPLIPSGCGPFVEITGFGYDPLDRAVVGWDLHNHCNGIPGSRWARKESGNWNINVFEPNILFPGGGDSDYAHQLALSDDGTPFMVYGALAQPWIEYFYTWQANLNTDPTGRGSQLGELLFHYRDCRQTGLKFALDFSPGGTSRNRVTRIGCTSPGGTFELRLNGSLFEFGGGSPGFAYATGPAGQHHEIHNPSGPLFYSNATPGSKLQIASIQRFSENLSIAVDANNRIHAAVGGFNSVADGDAGRMAYLTSTDGVNWTSTLLDHLDRHQSSVSISLDSAGNPAVAYLAGGAIWYAALNNGQWDKVQVRLVDQTYLVNHMRLKFDGNDVPHIAYYDTTTKEVRIASPADLNGPPALTNPGDQTNAESDSASLQVAAADPDNDVLTYGATGLPSGLSIDPSTGLITGTLPYTSAGSYPVTVTVTDGSLTDSEAFTWIVTNTNRAPEANDASASTPEDTPTNLTLAASDADSDSLTFSIVSQPSHGTLVLNGSSAIYSPAQDYTGADGFTYKANDGTSDSNVATVNLTVMPVNDIPDAANDAAATNEDAPVNINILANDTDADGDSLTVSAVSQGAHGLVVVNGNGSVSYAPAANFFGSDSFTYTVSDGQGGTDNASVNVTINPVNDAPLANNDSAAANEDTSVTIAAPGVLANDQDVEGNPLSAVRVSGPANGFLTLNADGSFTYIPDQNFNGTDSFTYRSSDGAAQSNLATVSIVIYPDNDAPVAANDNYKLNPGATLTMTAPGVLANDSDVEGGVLSASLVNGPPNGSVTLNPNGSFDYTVNAGFSGTDSFTYRASDGATDSDTATVFLTIRGAGTAACSTTVTVEANFTRKSSTRASKVPVKNARVIMLPKSRVQALCANLLDAGCVWANLAAINTAGDPVVQTGADGKVVASSTVADSNGWAIFIDVLGATAEGTAAPLISQGTTQIAVSNSDCASNKRFTLILVTDGTTTTSMTQRQQILHGSVLEVSYPDFAEWSGTQFLYPVVFSSDSAWEVDICGSMPPGYRITGESCAQFFLSNDTKVIFFDVREQEDGNAGSQSRLLSRIRLAAQQGKPDPRLNMSLRVKHKGKYQTANLEVPGKKARKKNAN